MRNAILHRILFLLIGLAAATGVRAQIREVPLQQIPQQRQRYEFTRNLFQYWQVMQRSGGGGGKDAPYGTLQLIDVPFFDDFSTTTVKPDSTKWFSSSGQFAVYVNNVFGGTPPSVGVASFDGIAANGLAYNSNPRAVGPADSLTSQGFRLAGKDTNNLFLTFFLQAGNREKETRPDTADSLIVQFLQPNGAYRTMAKFKGIQEDSLPPSYHFRQVRVPGRYFRDGFRFKFVGHGTLNGAFDVWNLDYVRLDYRQPDGSGRVDSSATDLAMSTQPGPLFDRYRSVPIDHLKDVVRLSDSTTSAITNLNRNIINFNLEYHARELRNNQIGRELLYVPTGGANIEGTASPLQVGETRRVRLIRPAAEPRFALPANPEAMKYQAEYSIVQEPNGFNTVQSNDTVRSVGSLVDYYAYDDEGYEKSFVLVGNGARLLYRFVPFKPLDSLRAVSFGIDARTFTTNTFVPFNLVIYRKIKGVDGSPNDEVLHFVASGLTPALIQTTNWVTVATTRPIKVDGPFYVGFQQGTGVENSVYIQADINSIAESALYYSIQAGQWDRYTQSRNALLIHPHFYCPSCPVGIRKPVASLSFQVYPNPNRAAGRLRIEGMVNAASLIAPDGRALAEFAAGQGQTLRDVALPAGLAPGLYLLKGVGKDGAFGTVRITID